MGNWKIQNNNLNRRNIDIKFILYQYSFNVSYFIALNVIPILK